MKGHNQNDPPDSSKPMLSTEWGQRTRPGALISPTRTHNTVRGVSTERRFAVLVSDQSLIGFGLYPNDVIINIETELVREGQLVTAMTPGGLIVRVGQQCDSPGRIVLASGNPIYGLVEYEENEVHIYGRAIYAERLGGGPLEASWEQVDIPEDLSSVSNGIHHRNRQFLMTNREAK